MVSPFDFFHLGSSSDLANQGIESSVFVGANPVGIVDGPLSQRLEVPSNYDAIFHRGEAGGHNPSFPDISLQNERAMWWAEFDSVGEETVRGYVERNSYTPTGMEVAREWLARREFLQLRDDVQSLKAFAGRAGGTASESQSASEISTLASQVDANSRAIVEIAATAKKDARTMFFVGMAASLLALCAIVVVLASSRQVAPNAKQTAVQTARPKQAVVRPPSPAGPRVETRQVSASLPENAQEESSNASQSNSPALKTQAQSVEEVLALVADKVGGEGAINFTAQFHDRTTGSEHAEQLSYKASNVTIDPNRCLVGYRWQVEQNGTQLSDQNRTVDLRLAKSARVTSIDAEPGRRFSMRAYPRVYAVHIARWDNVSEDALYFRDQGTAARVGTAIRRAVELCDNGERQFRPR